MLNSGDSIPETASGNPGKFQMREFNKNKFMRENKQISNHGKGKDKIMVVRYEGFENIRKMVKEGKYIEAFVHIQLGIEKVLWDKIVTLFKGEKAMIVRRTINESEYITKTSELVKWAYFLGAINENEHKDLRFFNKKRNSIIHRAGKEWEIKKWKNQEYIGALEKGIKFLEKNKLKSL